MLNSSKTHNLDNESADQNEPPKTKMSTKNSHFTHLHPDLILYIFDMLIVQPREFVNIFSLNHHWREFTEHNEVFWERQLCGLLYMFVRNDHQRNNNNNHNDPSLKSKHNNPYGNEIAHIDHIQFYKKYFFNRTEMNILLNQHSIFRSLFKEMHSKLLDFIRTKSIMMHVQFNNDEHVVTEVPIMDLSSQHLSCTIENSFQMDDTHSRESSTRLHDPETRIELIKSIFLYCYNSIKAKKNAQRLKEELQLVTQHDFNWRRTGIFNCDYFDSYNDFEYHSNIVGSDSLTSTIAAQNIDRYWRLLLNLQETDAHKVIQLQKRFLIKCTRKNQGLIKDMVCVLRETSRSYHDSVVLEKTQTVSQQVALNCIFDSIVHQLSYLEKEERMRTFKYLVLTFMIDCFSHQDLFIAASCFESFKNYFQAISYKQVFEQTLDVHYTKIRRLSIKANDERSIFLLEYMLNTIRLSRPLFSSLVYNHNTLSDIALPYYCSLSAEPTLLYVEDPGDEDFLRQCLLKCRNVYLKHGKDEKQFWKDVKNSLRCLCSMDIEISKSQFIIKELFASLKNVGLLTKSNIASEAKKLYLRAWRNGNLETCIEWTKFFVSEFNISPVRVTYEWTTFSSYFTKEELLESSKNFPEIDNKKKKSSKEIEFKDMDCDVICHMNPICDFVLLSGVDTLKEMLKDQFLAQYWNDVVTVPFLYDTLYPRPTIAGDESLVYCCYSFNDNHRLYLKKMKLKQLIQFLINKKEPKN
ncbi:hypothetical protein C9374_012539 [Naegleria lovaniensis]|uniref:F-box domain-containing protein n=1 Tax=Naegleria lovaniensis TaxID=51637 RepID=A0AA88KQF5_NAELO|nr:uncharacterized protein C9374_012539 [Naegleria lovaniensis]KAG2392287.1 hypothetical protein C9374_012539 [Naegleria lovaniensis]